MNDKRTKYNKVGEMRGRQTRYLKPAKSIFNSANNVGLEAGQP